MNCGRLCSKKPTTPGCGLPSVARRGKWWVLPPPHVEHPASPIAHVHPSFPEVRIHLTARGVQRLEREPHLASRLQHKGDGGGWLSVRLRPEEYDWLVRVLLSLGTDAMVLAPEGLRMRVQQAAEAIAWNSAQM